jgi:hypothetical protein
VVPDYFFDAVAACLVGFRGAPLMSIQLVNGFLWMSLVLVVVTKIGDAWTTYLFVSAKGESNLFAAPLMRRFGVGVGIAVVMVVFAIIVYVTYNIALERGLVGKLVVSLTSLVASVFQVAVAHTNYSGRVNRVSSLVLGAHGRVAILMRWRKP